MIEKYANHGCSAGIQCWFTLEVVKKCLLGKKCAFIYTQQKRNAYFFTYQINFKTIDGITIFSIIVIYIKNNIALLKPRSRQVSLDWSCLW